MLQQKKEEEQMERVCLVHENTTNTKYYMQQLQPMSQTMFVAATANIAYSDAVCALAPANSDTANVPTYFELHSNLLFFFF